MQVQSPSSSTMAGLHALALAALGLIAPALAQQSDTVWGAVIVSTFGDRVPLLSPDVSALTPLGAAQMFSAGQLFRERYIAPANDSLGRNYTIANISTDRVDALETVAYAPSDLFLAQSAQAFMAGLYPPAGNASASSPLANGSAVASPLGGAQFPLIVTPGANDPAAVFLAGQRNCPMLAAARRAYSTSPEASALRDSSRGFYDGLGAALSGADSQYYPRSYGASSYSIWEWLHYQAVHGGAAVVANASTLAQARALADAYAWATAGNATADRGLRPLAGRTLISQVAASLWANARAGGAQAKLTAFVTDNPPVVGLLALLGLGDVSSSYRGLPDPASSLVFELFTPGNTSASSSANASTVAYPDSADDLRVRVLFRNGTNSPTNLNAVPVYGRGPDALDIPLTDFSRATAAVAVPDAGDWCTACGRGGGGVAPLFCAALTNGSVGLSGGSSPGSSGGAGGGGGVSAPVAGVIGAVVTLAVLGLVGALAVLLGGVRVRREPRGKKRASQLGGFKGGEKLARYVRSTSHARPNDG